MPGERPGRLEWQATIGQSLTLSAQHGRFEHVNQYTGFAPGVPRSLDITTLKEDGDAVSDGRYSTNGQIHDRAVLSWYRPDLLAGNHAFTFGIDFIDGGNGATNPPRRSGDYRLRFNNSAPFQIDIYNLPNAPELRTRYFAAYVQDSWTINRRLTLSIGLRGQRDRGWVPAQCQRLGTFVQAFPENCNAEVQPNIFNSFTPRVHAAFDVTGDGRSVIKGGYGRFVHLRSTGAEINNFNKNGQRTMTYDWHDLNGDRDYDPGEVNLDPNGADFRSGGAQLNAFLNPDENIPGAEEYSIAFERQLTQTVAVRVGGVYLKNYNINRNLNPLRPYEVYTIPISRPDPGPDGVNNTSDDTGQTLTYWDYPASYRGARFEGIKLVNDDPKNDSTYKTIEVAATRRLSSGWQFLGSYSATKRHVPFVDGSALTPNAEINIADDTWTWIGKLSGSYTFPKGILSGGSYSIRNGARLARQVQIIAPAGASITNLVVNAEPIGSLSLENVGLFDLRVAKRFGLGLGRSLELAPRLLQRAEREPGDVNRDARGSYVRERHGVGRRRSERNRPDTAADFPDGDAFYVLGSRATVRHRGPKLRSRSSVLPFSVQRSRRTRFAGGSLTESSTVPRPSRRSCPAPTRRQARAMVCTYAPFAPCSSREERWSLRSKTTFPSRDLIVVAMSTVCGAVPDQS